MGRKNRRRCLSRGRPSSEPAAAAGEVGPRPRGEASPGSPPVPAAPPCVLGASPAVTKAFILLPRAKVNRYSGLVTGKLGTCLSALRWLVRSFPLSFINTRYLTPSPPTSPLPVQARSRAAVSLAFLRPPSRPAVCSSKVHPIKTRIQSPYCQAGTFQILLSEYEPPPHSAPPQPYLPTLYCSDSQARAYPRTFALVLPRAWNTVPLGNLQGTVHRLLQVSARLTPLFKMQPSPPPPTSTSDLPLLPPPPRTQHLLPVISFGV